VEARNVTTSTRWKLFVFRDRASGGEIKRQLS
jgi:hypothetical protein